MANLYAGSMFQKAEAAMDKTCFQGPAIQQSLIVRIQSMPILPKQMGWVETLEARQSSKPLDPMPFRVL